MDTTVSGVGVIDKSMALIDALSHGPCTTTQLTERTGITRATVQRQARKVAKDYALQCAHLAVPKMTFD